ncbi:winged helix-turn-helix domain-containing protein [Alicyclobacillus acidoterrestris]|uniref:Winged helix-turn-helix domain-containing protein n=1 Tax=Alicyclobacillus acidoterrestris (strain ATCC 49025 / DSM 3922 / CIP 106132 / NCIMB 13137 / GD3B) TaxID=1356854 RepID=T0D5T4_ALIAG|nr:winged helix-turn-helix domain-containing protein [Alicyclobacillus acidoterrestris]EPZ45076.1 hypothetical protein N007_09715 [Alicyclobacillus acidoterrestris ATCC 49025]UNO48365.1 winged helix-turn-helix domain-containing protein [Alicyclobacillus acidoterrestris]
MDTNFTQVALRPGLVLDFHREELVQDGLSVSLSKIQFRILHLLALHLGHPVRTDDIIEYAWGKERNISRSELYVYISRLRARVGDNPYSPKLIISIRGLGYLLRSEMEKSS